MWRYEQFKLLAPECGVVTDLKESGWSDEEEEKQPAVSGGEKPAPPGLVTELREYPDVFVELESSSEDWLGFYAGKNYHVIAVHALDDPESRQVGKDHPGTHGVILESAAANTLMLRYV